MRSIAIWVALALLGGGCHCGQKFNSLAPKLVIVQPTARDGGEWILDLGAVPVPGAQSGQIVIQNDGQIAAKLLSAKLRAGSDPALSFTPPALPDSIVGGGSLSMPVKYTPASAGSAVGWVDLTTDDPGLLSATVLLLANGESSELQVCVELPADGGWRCNGGQQTMSVDFGPLQLGSTGSRHVQVRNIGNGPMQYLGTTLSAATSPEYTLSPSQGEPDGGVAVDAGALRQFSLVFAPTSFGAATGMATVSTTDPTTPWVNIDVVGHGLASANCALQVSPTQVAFGSVPNTAPADQALVVVNAGAQPCHISGLPLTGSAAFTVPGAPTLPVTLPSNGVLSLDV
ncbi:MAG TPA: choice-of-anchor D domain-containing protein, partial [Myxococcaceae bacterium]|nr:choice-of-anchor D domain-containing protein [Myxococcaceae bacterium]